jgi:hypothetical protein
MTEQQLASLKYIIKMQSITISAQRQIIAAQNLVLEAAAERFKLQGKRPAEKPMLRLVE